MFRMITVVMMMIAVSVVLGACKESQTALNAYQGMPQAPVKGTDGKPVAQKRMMCVTNHVPLYGYGPDFEQFTTLDITSNTNLPVIDQLMKYDDAGVCFEKGGYAYIIAPGDKAGWVSTNALADWNIPALFAVKDNVFPVKSNITLYSDPLSGNETVGVVEIGDTLRVLKGNGARYLIVSRKGLIGWAEINLKNYNLIAKSLFIRDSTNIIIVKSLKYKDQSGKPLNYKILPYDFSYNSITNTNYFELIPHFINNYNNQKKEYYVRQFNKEIYINEKLDLNDNIWIENINNKIYNFKQIVINNFYGFFAVIDIGIPEEYINIYNNYKYNVINSDRMTWDQFDKYIDYVKSKGVLKEFVRIKLFTRDINLKKIKEVIISGSFAFEISLSYLKNELNSMFYSDYDLIANFAIANNDVILDDTPFIIDNGITYKLFPDFVSTNNFSKKSNSLKPFIYSIKFSKKELSEFNINANDLIRTWNNYKNIIDQNTISNNKFVIKEVVKYCITSGLVLDESQIGINKQLYIYKPIYINNNNYLVYYKNKYESGLFIVNPNGNILYKRIFLKKEIGVGNVFYADGILVIEYGIDSELIYSINQGVYYVY